jgi:hypothetical protein
MRGIPYRGFHPRNRVSHLVVEAEEYEDKALAVDFVAEFHSLRAKSEAVWVDALIAFLEWAPPVVEKRPVLPAPNEECVRRGLLVGAVVRWARPEHAETRAWRATVIAHDDNGDPITLDARGNMRWGSASVYTLVLPPLQPWT